MLAPRRGETPAQYVISFWPMAPLFGVPWRFEALMPTARFFQPSVVAAQMAEASAAEAARVVEEATEKAAEVVDAFARSVAEVAEVIEGAVALDAPVAVAADAWVADAADAQVVLDAPALVAADGDRSAATGGDRSTPERPATLFDAPPAAVDDLKQIRGVGPKLERQLNALGVYRLDQIAGFSEADLAWIDANLTAFRGRPLRDGWVAQARALL